MERTTNGELTLVPVAGDGRAASWAVLTRAWQAGERKPADAAMSSRERARLIRAATDARAALREAALAAAEAAARARSVADALDEALAALRDADGDQSAEPARRPGGRPQSRVDGLSPREREVLALVAEGRSNKSIAEALYVSPNTVKTHVASLLNKLHAGTRVELAAIATRQQIGATL